MPDIPVVRAYKTLKKDIQLDPNGFFVIEVAKEIRVEYYFNVYKQGEVVSGKLETVFVGRRADALCDTIARHIPHLLPEHYLYLGRQLQKAEDCLKAGEKYIQDGC